MMTASPFDRARGSGAPTISALVETLRQIHEDKTRDLSPASPDPSAQGDAEPARRYRSLRKELELAEANARRRDETVERGFRERAKAAPAPYQETLYLRCQRHGRSAGRFRCDNRLGQKTDVRIVKRRWTSQSALISVEPSLTVEPERFPLEADASAVVSVSIDLTSSPEISTGVLETSLDLVMDEALALKLWIEVDVYELS
jgi:hypothetical protein